MDFMNNVVKSSNALLKEKLNNPFGSNKQQANEQDQLQQQQQSNNSTNTNSSNSETNQPTTSSSDYQQQDANGSNSQQPGSPQDAESSSQNQKNSQFAAIAADAEVVTQKAVKGAKDFGSFLFSMGNKAAQTVSQTAKQVKEAVENTTILTDFTREQQEFIKEHGGSMQSGKFPWSDCKDQAKASIIREQILSLSQDKRTFVKSPPNDANFQFNSQECYPIALSLLKEDPNLATMRFELVPKLVNEDTFWCNYFYRVSLVKQMCDKVEDPTRQGWASSRSSSGEGPDELACNTTDQDNNQEPTSPSYSATSTTQPPVAIPETSTITNTILDPTTTTNINSNQEQIGNSAIKNTDFNLDDYVTRYSGAIEDDSYNLITDDEDLKNKLRELNIGSIDGQDVVKAEEEEKDDDDDIDKWEEELQKDLQEFELVNGSDVDALDELDLDREILELEKEKG